MLTKGDDYPIHQLPLPVSEVGSERNFYDRYFFNGYNKEGDVFFAAALCVYPNLNIMDGSFVVVRNKTICQKLKEGFNLFLVVCVCMHSIYGCAVFF